ncbi:MAG: helix-turn-helix domain-containing protein [Planctomycetota bacterium]
MSDQTAQNENGDRDSKLVIVEDTFPNGEPAFDYWRTVCRPVFEAMPRTPLTQFRLATRFAKVDKLIFNQVAFSAMRYVRSPEVVRGGESDHVTLHLPRVGVERGVLSGHKVRMSPDRVTLCDWAHPYETSAEETEKLGILVPRERIEAIDWVYRSSPTLNWSRTTGSGRALARLCLETWEGLPNAAESDAPALADKLVELVNGLIYDTRHGRQPRTPRCSGETQADAMKRYLEEHLDDPDLGPEMLARVFRVSRATVYRNFAVPGGIKGYIQDHRLARCYRELASPKHSFKHIYEVHERWGFFNASYFHRIFKERYGKSPAEVALEGRAVLSRGHTRAREFSHSIRRLHQWLE